MAPDSYLLGVLADGARPFVFRPGTHELLGLPDLTGVRVTFAAMPSGRRFAYLRPDGAAGRSTVEDNAHWWVDSEDPEAVAGQPVYGVEGPQGSGRPLWTEGSAAVRPEPTPAAQSETAITITLPDAVSTDAEPGAVVPDTGPGAVPADAQVSTVSTGAGLSTVLADARLSALGPDDGSVGNGLPGTGLPGLGFVGDDMAGLGFVGDDMAGHGLAGHDMADGLSDTAPADTPPSEHTTHVRTDRRKPVHIPAAESRDPRFLSDPADSTDSGGRRLPRLPQAPMATGHGPHLPAKARPGHPANTSGNTLPVKSRPVDHPAARSSDPRFLSDPVGSPDSGGRTQLATTAANAEPGAGPAIRPGPPPSVTTTRPSPEPRPAPPAHEPPPPEPPPHQPPPAATAARPGPRPPEPRAFWERRHLRLTRLRLLR